MGAQIPEIEITPTRWVSDFLWHWQQSGMSPQDAARIILTVVETCQQVGLQKKQFVLPISQQIFEMSALSENRPLQVFLDVLSAQASGDVNA